MPSPLATGSRNEDRHAGAEEDPVAEGEAKPAESVFVKYNSFDN
jgi:hypothetical protein